MSTLSTTNLKNPSAGSNNIVLGTDGSTRVTTLADSAGSNTSTPAEIASGRAKAWVNFNGTGTVAIRASYNVSSITDNGAGDYTVNFTTALVDANYSVVGTAAALSTSTSSANNGKEMFFSLYATSPLSASSTRFRTNFNGGDGEYGSAPADSATICVAIFR
jgi:hypothetical protein